MKVNSGITAHLPDFIEPMKAKLVDSMRSGDWIYEIKFDGYRALAWLVLNRPPTSIPNWSHVPVS